MGITNKHETVTPELATRWLEANEVNRPVDQGTVDRYGRDMLAGKWLLAEGTPIQFGASGRLLNGQHRLWAAVQYDCAFDAYVMRGIPREQEDEVMKVIDTGKKRTLANALHIAGEANATVLAAVVNTSWRYQLDRLRSNMFPTHEEAFAWLHSNPEVRQSPEVARAAYKELKAPNGSVGAAWYLNAQTDAEAADRFWHLAATGEGLTGNSPILAYRRWAIGRLSQREKPSANTWLAYNLKAMNAWRAGKRMRLLAVKPEEGIPELWA